MSKPIVASTDSGTGLPGAPDDKLIPSYAEIAEQTFGTLWQEAQPADWALIVYYLRRDAKQRCVAVAPQWIPLVGSDVPVEGELVLAAWPKQLGTAVYKDGVWGDEDGEREYGPPTHWMPLPAAPV